MTSGIVEHVRNALLTNVNVPEEKKPGGNSDVLVVYFQVTSSFKEIYGYSVINHSFLENPQTLQMIDNKDNIQLYLHRNAKKRIELQAAGTISIVVHSDLQIESMSVTTFVEPGDIVLWIRTNLEVNVIKKTLSNLFQSMLNTLYVKCTNTERCERTIRDVDDIANIIKGEYKDIVIRAPAKRPPAPAKLPPRGVSLSFDAYVNSIPVPREPVNQIEMYMNYFKEGANGLMDGKPISEVFGVRTNIPEEQSVLRPTRMLKESQELDAKAGITRYTRLQYAVAMKDTAAYIIKMIDYFHQILDLQFGSSTIIGSELDFFYGADLGTHKNLSGPTPALEDLMDHMWDMRMGFVYIDFLCHVLGNGIGRAMYNSRTEPSNKLKVFTQRCIDGDERYQDGDAFFGYFNYKRTAYVQKARKLLIENTPDDDFMLDAGLSRYEIKRLTSTVTKCSLRNYWEAAKLLKLEKVFAFLEPDFGLINKPTSMELLVGQRKLPDAGLFLPLMVDGQYIPRPAFRFIAAWREIVMEILKNSMDELLYQMGKNKQMEPLKAFENILDSPERMLNQLLLVGGPLRAQLAKIANDAFIKVFEAIETRYSMERSLYVQERETSGVGSEYYTYQDVFKILKAEDPRWEDKQYRLDNLSKWVQIPDMFNRPEPLKIGTVQVSSLDDIEWRALFCIVLALQDEEDFY